MSQLTISWSQAQQVAQDQKIKERQWQVEFEQRKAEAQEDVLNRIFNSDIPFTYYDIEELMHEHGLEMDYIEEFLI